MPELATALVAPLLAWFARARRELAWREVDARRGRRDPYRVLVSEIMLQQTQVARVEEKFGPFLEAFPDVAALARADEQEVLAAWTGLGYYRRARLLHAAAREIVARHGGVVPAELEQLRALPGIGAYTAGAIASLAHGVVTPVVDTNVARVLLRVGGVEARVDDPAAQRWAWAQATRLVEHAGARHAGDLNESLMELGALVCSAKSPACAACPLRTRCAARAAGRQDAIPLAKAKPARSAIVHACLVVRDGAGRVLLEQRPRDGLWGGLWQVPAWEMEGTPCSLPTPAGLAKSLGIGAGRRDASVDADFIFQTTHRDVRFVVRGWRVSTSRSLARGRRWCTIAEALALGMSSPMRRILRSL